MKTGFIKKATGKEKVTSAIVSDGKSYFLLNMFADSLTRVVVKFEKTTGSTFQLGAIDNSYQVFAEIGSDDEDAICEVAYCKSRYANAAKAMREPGEHELELSYAAKYDDGKLLMVPKSKFSISYELALLGINDNREVKCDEKQAGTKLLSCKIFSGDKLIRDYVPSEDENGTKCLLEKVGSFVIYPQPVGGLR